MSYTRPAAISRRLSSDDAMISSKVGFITSSKGGGLLCSFIAVSCANLSHAPPSLRQRHAPIAARMNPRFSAGMRCTPAIPRSRTRRTTGLSVLNSRSSTSVAPSIIRLSGRRRR